MAAQELSRVVRRLAFQIVRYHLLDLSANQVHLFFIKIHVIAECDFLLAGVSRVLRPEWRNLA